MTRQQLAGIVAAALLSTVLAVGVGAFLLSGDDPKPARTADRRVARLDAGDEPGAAKARPRGAPVKRKAGDRPAGAAPAGARPKGAKSGAGARREMDPEARASHREEGLARRTELLEQYADQQGWDDATTDQIGAIMTDTTDYVSGTMARVEAGEDFADLREEIRAFRAKQAAAMKELVGEEEFPTFIEAMHMQRFFAGEGGGAGGAAGGGAGPRAGRPRGGGPRGGGR